MVEQVTARLAGFDNAAWLPLSGGRTNFAWKVTPENQRDPVVVKLYTGPAKNPLFPNEPQSEARLLHELKDCAIAPRFIDAFETPAGACNVYAHIPGEQWQADVALAGDMVRKLHHLPVPTGLRPVANGSAELTTQTMAILAECAVSDDLLAVQPKGLVPRSEETRLLHGDIVPGNLIQSDSGLRLIDWQCPATGDPCEDIAIFLSPAMQHLYQNEPLSPAAMDAFFAAYDAPEIAARYHQLAPWYHWRMAAYCRWQAENGRSDYARGIDLEVKALQRSFNP